VDPEERVKAYGVIMKNGAASKPIETANGPITLGKTTFAEALSSGLAKVSSVCGAKHEYQYEVSQSSGATGNREYAFGVTLTAVNSASAAEKFSSVACNPEVEAAVQEYVYKGIALESDLLAPPQNYEGYLASTRAMREATAINSIFVTAPGTEIVEEMINIHPSEISDVDPWRK
jgi:hypothetical protein